MSELNIPVCCDELESPDKFYRVFEKLDFDINESLDVLRSNNDGVIYDV